MITCLTWSSQTEIAGPIRRFLVKHTIVCVTHLVLASISGNIFVITMHMGGPWYEPCRDRENDLQGFTMSGNSRQQTWRRVRLQEYEVELVQTMDARLRERRRRVS